MIIDWDDPGLIQSTKIRLDDMFAETYANEASNTIDWPDYSGMRFFRMDSDLIPIATPPFNTASDVWFGIYPYNTEFVKLQNIFSNTGLKYINAPFTLFPPQLPTGLLDRLSLLQVLDLINARGLTFETIDTLLQHEPLRILAIIGSEGIYGADGLAVQFLRKNHVLFLSKAVWIPEFHLFTNDDQWQQYISINETKTILLRHLDTIGIRKLAIQFARYTIHD